MAREIFMRLVDLGGAQIAGFGPLLLAPADAKGREQMGKLKSEQLLGVTVRQKRNLAHHNKYWALIDAVWEHQALYPTVTALSDGVKLACGLTEETLNPLTMEVSLKPSSIAFDAMDQDDFEQFYERAIGIIIERILPGVNSRDLDRRVQDIMKGRG